MWKFWVFKIIKVFKDIKCLGEISSNWPKDLLGKNVYKTIC